MEKRFSDMIQVSAKGSLVLVLGQMGSTLISAIGAIIVARILGSTNFGVVSIALIPVNISLLFMNNGIGAAMIKYLIENRYEENMQNQRSIVLAGFSINIIIGLLASSSLYLLADFMANQVFHISELGQLIKILSISVLAQFLLQTANEVFVGYERMEIRSIVSILFSVLKSVISPLLVFLGYGVLGAAYGYTLPFLATAIIAVILVLQFFRGAPSSPSTQFSEYVLPIANYAYPLFISNILSGGLNQVFFFILPFYVTASVMGNFSAANNFTMLVTLFTIPLATATFPLLSKLKKGDEVLGFVVQNIIKYESMIIFPVAAAVFALSDIMVETLYGVTYTITPFFIKITLLNFFFIGLGDLVVSNLLNSQKDTKVILHMTLIYLLIGAPIGILLIPWLGVLGFQITQLLAPRFGLLYALWWIRKNYRVTVDIGSTLKIGISTMIGYLLCITTTSLIDLNPWMELFLGGLVLAASYLLSILLTGALTRKNIGDIQDLIRNYEKVKKLSDPIFAIIIRLSRE